MFICLVNKIVPDDAGHLCYQLLPFLPLLLSYHIHYVCVVVTDETLMELISPSCGIDSMGKYMYLYWNM